MPDDVGRRALPTPSFKAYFHADHIPTDPAEGRNGCEVVPTEVA